MTFVPLQLPQLLDVTTMEEPQFYGDYVLLTFPLHDPYDLEEVMDMLEDDMELIVLYHHIPMQDEPAIVHALTPIHLSAKCSR